MALSDIKTPKRKDLTIVRNDSFRRRVTISQGGTAINLTGYSIEGQIRREVDGPVLATFTIENRVDVSGQFEIVLTTTQTASLQGRLCWDLQVRLIGSEATNTHTVVAGLVNVIADKTRV